MQPTVIRRPRAAQDIASGIRLARMHGKDISPAAVARTLRLAKVGYVLVGAHAANGYTGRPRATVDVDVVVRSPAKAAKAVAAAFPQLQMQPLPHVIRFMDADTEAIDLIKPVGSPLWAQLLKRTREISMEGEAVLIPVLEALLAAKFAAMVSPFRRQPDKLQDGADFIRMIEANAEIDLGVVNDLGELVYAGGGTEMIKLVTDAREGRRLEF